MGRSIGAVVVGYLVMAILVIVTTQAVTALFPAWCSPQNITYVLFNLAYSLVFALVGGYATAFVAGRAEVRHAAVLAGLAVVLAILTLVAEYGKQPLWYQVALLVVMPVAMVGGGYCRSRQVTEPRP